MPNRKELEDARDVLQRAHDYVEVYGFDIGEIATRGADDWSAGREGKVDAGPACFIGAYLALLGRG